MNHRAMRGTAFLLELAGVALIGGAAHPSARAVLTEVGERLDVSEKCVGEFADFALQSRRLEIPRDLSITCPL